MFGDVSNKFMLTFPHNHTHAHRHAHHVTALPYCVDDEPGHVTLGGKVCSTIQGQAAFLCNGLLAMQQASCEELASEWFMRSMVEKVGLVPDGRGAAIYGNYSKAMVQVHTKAARGKVGLWQSPAQLAAALIYVGSRVEVKRYIEVGVYTAWTCCFVSAYLRRVGRLGTFKGYAVDLVSTNIAHGTRDLLPKLNVTFTFRKSVVLNKTLPYDFCFIDGDHAYLGVRRDYASFAPSCNYMMFHDIQVTVITPLTACCVFPSLPPHSSLQDTSTTHLSNFSGGVPMFWAHLTSHTRKHRLAEFTHEPASDAKLPSFGLGVIGPNHRGTCEPDKPVDEWTPSWGVGDGVNRDAQIETTWKEFCRLNRTRLCDLGWTTLKAAGG